MTTDQTQLRHWYNTLAQAISAADVATILGARQWSQLSRWLSTPSDAPSTLPVRLEVSSNCLQVVRAQLVGDTVSYWFMSMPLPHLDGRRPREVIPSLSRTDDEIAAALIAAAQRPYGSRDPYSL